MRDIAATYYTFGEGERLTAKMKELALSPAMLADVVDMADLYSDRAVTRLPRAVARLDDAQLRLRGAGHCRIHAAGDQRPARHVAQRRLLAQIKGSSAASQNRMR